MRPTWVLTFAVLTSSACVPVSQTDEPFDFSTLATVVITQLLNPERPPVDEAYAHTPREVDPKKPGVFATGEQGRYLIAGWSLPVAFSPPLRQWTEPDCEESKIRLDQAEVTYCVEQRIDEVNNRELVDVKCDNWLGPTELRTNPVLVPSPGAGLCDFAKYSPLASYTVTHVDVQSAYIETGLARRASAGQATVVAPLGGERVVLGQYSATLPLPSGEESPQDTELATYSVPSAGTSTQPFAGSRVRTSILWSAGMARDADSVWLGSSEGHLWQYVFPSRATTATMAEVVPRSAVGRVTDLAVHPADPERVYAVTAACAVLVREPGARIWTTLVEPIASLVLRPPINAGCAGRVTMVAPGRARIVGIPRTTGTPTTNANYGYRVDAVLNVEGLTVTDVDVTWPEDSEVVLRQLRGVVVFEEEPGKLLEAAMGSAYTRVSTPEQVPFDFGAGSSWVFLRAAGSNATWEAVRVRSVYQGQVIDEPILFGDAAPIALPDGDRTIRGFVAGAHLRLHVFDIQRRRDGNSPVMASFGSTWHVTGTYPFATRVRDDGAGGVIIGTGDDNDAHALLGPRFHWLRPRR